MKNYLCSVCGTPCIYIGDKPKLSCECDKHGEWVLDYCTSYWKTSNGAKPIPVDDYIPIKRQL